MLSALFASLLTTALAVSCALVVGLALGQLATEWLGARSFAVRLTELRGALPTLVAAPLLDGWLELPATITLGLLVGGYQGLSVAHWVRGVRTFGKSPARAPAQAAPLRRALRRIWTSPVKGTVTLCALHVVSLEAILSLLELPPLTVSLGSWLAQALAPPARLGAVLALTCLFLLLDLGTERIGPAARPSAPRDTAP